MYVSIYIYRYIASILVLNIPDINSLSHFGFVSCLQVCVCLWIFIPVIVCFTLPIAQNCSFSPQSLGFNSPCTVQVTGYC